MNSGLSVSHVFMLHMLAAYQLISGFQSKVPVNFSEGVTVRERCNTLQRVSVDLTLTLRAFF